MSKATTAGGESSQRRAQYRYGVVFLIVATLLMFEVLAPDRNWARAISIGLAAAALAVAVATSRARAPVRRHRVLIVALVAIVVIVGIASGVFSAPFAFLIVTFLIASVPVVLVGGLLRLIRDVGVTIQAVAGALAIYLVVGLLFASVISFVAYVDRQPYFKQGGKASNGERVYYSFTVLTTTGFGDYTAATSVGHALAVFEMLTGQLYLVTVIGIVVGNYAGRRVRNGRPERTGTE